MMLTRIDDFFAFLSIEGGDREFCMRKATLAAERAQGMTAVKDYEALAAIALYYHPRHIFEIGTYRGVTSDFFLSILPDCDVVSIAYKNPRWRFLGRSFNNSELKTREIGEAVYGARRARFTQLYGDSHELKSQSLLKEYGRFDLVFIDGDHSAKGVALDTELAQQIITTSGLLCWHDANPKPKYVDVRRYLEEELPISALATKDDYVGGVAVWSREIEERLNGQSIAGFEMVRKGRHAGG